MSIVIDIDDTPSVFFVYALCAWKPLTVELLEKLRHSNDREGVKGQENTDAKKKYGEKTIK